MAIINYILRILFWLRWEPRFSFDTYLEDTFDFEILWWKERQDTYINNYGWKDYLDKLWEPPRSVWTTYKLKQCPQCGLKTGEHKTDCGRSKYDYTKGYMVKPNSRVDAWMKLDTLGFNAQDSSAFWLYDQDNGPYLETDIVEVQIIDGQFKLLFTSYVSKTNEQKDAKRFGWSMVVPYSFLCEYHLFSVKWVYKEVFGVKIKYLVWYVDNIPVAMSFNAPGQPLHLVITNCDLQNVDWIQVKEL